MTALLAPVWHVTVHVAVVFVFGLMAVLLGRWLVPALLRRVDDRSRVNLAEGGRRLPGGAWIGMLERLSIYAALMAHYPEAIAICLAMKGLARYPELKAPNSGAAELFIIGTFTSVLLACGCAGLAHWVVELW